jgi:hypothetical protein
MIFSARGTVIWSNHLLFPLRGRHRRGLERGPNLSSAGTFVMEAIGELFRNRDDGLGFDSGALEILRFRVLRSVNLGHQQS